ncbi:nuclear transport factor 2 family protein [Stakelama tenebrarum]|uniref:Nuclear transport factor 2 family protein n=1 Tax=Stakelama tenebrarum TaxID=2711215 RepID=A0A6G6Y7Z0_9SPHN|nr:nuclear transport factor 2 family protein [Sphingosinithalassobacter tenebrarum]QIG80828.1 nuclear transport factor 2 family protein [Sphingosinithalassobacter tenebrarum]
MSGAPDFADWLTLSNLKAAYCRLLDAKDWDGFAGLMTPDFALDVSASDGPVIAGRDAAVASIRGSIEAAKTVHQVHAPEIAIDGDAATGVWAMQDRLVWPNGRSLTGWGHYHERYVRTGEGWRIAESKLTRLHMDMVMPE